MITDISDIRKYLIASVVNSYANGSYLELGIDNGRNIEYICNNTTSDCIGVDVAPYNGTAGISFYNCTTDEFFEGSVENKKFDVIFIDADHRIESVTKDFENSLSVLKSGGLIILHDVDPVNKDFIDEDHGRYSANAYRIIDYIYNKHEELNVVVLPIDETGIAIVNRKHDRRVNSYL